MSDPKYPLLHRLARQVRELFRLEDDLRQMEKTLGLTSNPTILESLPLDNVSQAMDLVSLLISRVVSRAGNLHILISQPPKAVDTPSPCATPMQMQSLPPIPPSDQNMKQPSSPSCQSPAQTFAKSGTDRMIDVLHKLLGDLDFTRGSSGIPDPVHQTGDPIPPPRSSSHAPVKAKAKAKKK